MTRFTTHTPAVPATPGFGAAGNLDLTNTSSIKGGLYHAEFHAEEGGKEYDKDYYFTIALTYDLEVTKSKDPKDLNEKKYPLTARVPVKIQFTNRGLMEIDEFSAVAYIYDDNGIELYKDSIPWVADPGQELGLGESIDLVFDQFRPSDIGFYELRVLTYYVGDEEAMNNTWPWAGQDDHFFEVAPEIEAEALAILNPSNYEEFTGNDVTIYVGRPLVPRARYQNNGITDISDAPSEMVIRSIPDMDIVYSDNILVTDIPQGLVNNTSDFTFDEFVPPGPGNYQVCVSITAEDDDITDNNSICDTFTVVHAMNGVYTIGAEQNTGDDEADSAYNARNFTTVQGAIDALYLIGMTGPVTFEFTGASYDVGDILLAGMEPALDLRSKIIGMDETNTVTFRPNTSRSLTKGSVTINLYTGCGVGIIFGQYLEPLNQNAVILEVPPSRKPSYANSDGYFIFDGGNQKSLKFVLHTHTTTTLAVPFYLSQGTSNTQIKSCIITSDDPTNRYDDYSLPLTRFSDPQFLFEEDYRSSGADAYSTGILLRSIPPQSEINFFDPQSPDIDETNSYNLDTLVNTNVLLSNNEISGFAYGIVSLGIGPLMRDGQTRRYYNIDNTISGNYIHDVSRAGIFLGFEESTEVSGNKISGVANATTGFNSGIDVAGIMMGGEHKTIYNGYNNIGLVVDANEISNVGSAMNEAANNNIYGIKIEQCQNTYQTSSYPDVAENMLICNNAIWGILSGNAMNNRFGIRMFTMRNAAAGTWDQIMKSPIEGAYFTEGDRIAHNTILMGNDGYVTSGVTAGLTLQQSYEATVVNNAIAMLDDNIAGATNLYAAIFYQGIHPAEMGGINSNRNVYWLKGSGAVTDSAALVRFMYTDEASNEIYAGERNEFLTLNQWQMYTMSEDNLSIFGDFTVDLTTPNVNDPTSELRIENTPSWPVGSKLNNRGEILDYVLEDIDGNVRGTTGTNYDIGAFEFPGIMLNSDVEVTTSREPGSYRATTTTFSDAEYIMTEAPVDIQASLYNNGNFRQTGMAVDVKVYREKPGGGFYEDPELEERIETNIDASVTEVVSFNLADGEGKEFYPMTYGDWNKKYENWPAYADSIYTVPGWFSTMVNNVTPRYKIDISVQVDEDVSNNIYSKVVRFYLKRSMLNMLISVENSSYDMYEGASNDLLAGHRNYDSLVAYLKYIGWNNSWYQEEGEDTLLMQNFDVFERTAWEPRAVNYGIYQTVLWSDADENTLTREQTLDIDKFLSQGMTGDKKNLIIASQEMSRINYAGFEEFVKNTLRAWHDPAYPTDPLDGASYNAGVTQPARNVTDTSRYIIGGSVGRNLKQYIMRTGITPLDPDPMPGLMSVWAEGDGHATTAFWYNPYNEAVVAGPDPVERSMGTAVTSLTRNMVYMGVDWRHFEDGETIMRSVLDYLRTNGSPIVPVELLSFDAQALGNRVEISWETASENNSGVFELERAEVNENGRSLFTKISETDAAGTSTKALTYGPITDYDIEQNTTYVYRLKMVDLDGAYEYSREVEVTIGQGSFWLGSIMPNPVKYDAEIEYMLPESGYVNIEIYDVAGRMVLNAYNGESNSGLNKMTLDLSSLNSGLYNCVLHFGDHSAYKQLRVVK